MNVRVGDGPDRTFLADHPDLFTGRLERRSATQLASCRPLPSLRLPFERGHINDHHPEQSGPNDGPQCLNVSAKGSAAGGSEGDPHSLPRTANRSALDHVARVHQDGELLAHHRVAHTDEIPNSGELELAGLVEHSADPKPVGRMDGRIERADRWALVAVDGSAALDGVGHDLAVTFSRRGPITTIAPYVTKPATRGIHRQSVTELISQAISAMPPTRAMK